LIYKKIFTVNINSWKIHKLILSDTGKNSTDFENQKKKNIFVKFMQKRSAQKWATPKRATTKRAAPKGCASKKKLEL